MFSDEKQLLDESPVAAADSCRVNAELFGMAGTHAIHDRDDIIAEKLSLCRQGRSTAFSCVKHAINSTTSWQVRGGRNVAADAPFQPRCPLINESPNPLILTAMIRTAARIFSRANMGFEFRNHRAALVPERKGVAKWIPISLPQNKSLLWAQPVVAYIFAFACIASATILRAGFDWLDPGQRLLFAPYYLSVLVVSLVCGALPGVLTAVISLIVVWSAFVLPSRGELIPSEDLILRFVLFLVVALLIVWIARRYRSLVERLQTEQKERALLIRELQHRGRNTFTVIHAIVNQTLRGQSKEADKLTERIRALAATDELIIEAGNQGVDLKDLAKAELQAYGEERVSMQGGSVRLSPDLARTMSLVLHELATNAAKYGAFSTANGRVSVSWKIYSGVVNVAWKESGGPVVLPPTKHGFGLGLIGTLIRTYGGHGKSDFRRDGVIHKISFALNGDL